MTQDKVKSHNQDQKDKETSKELVETVTGNGNFDLTTLTSNLISLEIGNVVREVVLPPLAVEGQPGEPTFMVKPATQAHGAFWNDFLLEHGRNSKSGETKMPDKDEDDLIKGIYVLEGQNDVYRKLFGKHIIVGWKDYFMPEQGEKDGKPVLLLHEVPFSPEAAEVVSLNMPYDAFRIMRDFAIVAQNFRVSSIPDDADIEVIRGNSQSA